MTAPNSADPEDRAALVRLLMGGMAASTVGAAARLGVADALGDGELDAATVAERIGAPEHTTARLLRALAALGVLHERGPDRYALTPAGHLLRSDHEDSVRSLAHLYTDGLLLDSWQRLADAVRKADVAFETLHGAPFFSYLQNRPELSAMFNAAMADATRATARVLPDSYDFAPFTTVVDVGGGDGTLLGAVLARHPHLRGVLFDTADGLARAGEVLERTGTADRCTRVSGDFFARVPAGGNLYLLKSIVHDWDDERAAVILTRCREAASPGARLLLIEPLLPDTVAGAPSPAPFLSDLNMMLNPGGRERTRADIDALCAGAGFTVTGVRTLPPPSGQGLVEAVATGPDRPTGASGTP